MARLRPHPLMFHSCCSAQTCLLIYSLPLRCGFCVPVCAAGCRCAHCKFASPRSSRTRGRLQHRCRPQLCRRRVARFWAAMALSVAAINDAAGDVRTALGKDDADRARDVMLRLASTSVSAGVLKQAGDACKYFATLAKHSNAGVASAAGGLVAAWKEVVKADVKAASTSSSASAAPAKPPAQAQALITSMYKPASAAASSSSSSASSGMTPLERLRDALAHEPTGAGGAEVQAATGFAYADGPPKVDARRCRVLRKGGAASSSSSSGGSSSAPGPVIYWMSRDQRVGDNWALLRAQQRALDAGAPLVVVFCLLPSYADAPLRAYGFMLRGLRQVEADLAALGVPFRLLLGSPAAQVAGYANTVRASAVVTDYCPLRVPRQWKADVGARLHGSCALEEVDAHNVVPVWVASGKMEVGARTLRKKIHDAVGSFTTPFPAVQPHPHALPPAAEAGLATYQPPAAAGGSGGSSSAAAPADGDDRGEAPPAAVRLAPRVAGGLTDWPVALDHLSMDATVPEVTWAAPGERAGRDALLRFLTAAKLKSFDDLRNDPTQPGATSGLSPYLHFGQLSAQRVVLELQRATGHGLRHLFSEKRESGPQSFAEELVVRRELADNYCHYCADYDNLGGAWGWAQETLNVHAGDKRAHVYTLAQFEAGRTHEDLWNAAQMELVQGGKMHGFMRMYWAKKILEWAASPAEALRIAIYLNDKYSLDGRDPNGYVGCMWSIAGVHDMGWTERPIFGKIRFMNYDGCKRKFAVARYVAMHPVRPLPGAAAAAAKK